MSYITSDDLIFYTDNDKLYSGGFSVKSMMMRDGISPILTLNNQIQKGGEPNQVSDLFKDLVVPNWVMFFPQASQTGGATKHNQPDEDDNDDIIEEDIHDILLNLVNVDVVSGGQATVKKNKTRKSKKMFNKKGTRRHK